MLVKYALLALLVAVAVNAQFDGLPCGKNNVCLGNRICYTKTQLCYKDTYGPGQPNYGTNDGSGSGSGGSCVDNFTGKGNCPHFKKRGFCDTDDKALIKRWCAKTCNVC